MQDLFGGAIVAAVPGGWLDASDARPVPDHQEVWLERDGAERSVVIEILERVDATDDECAAFHFEEQAVHNDASSSSVLCSNRLAPELTRPSLQERGTCACTALQGTQLLPSGASDAAHPASLLVSLAVLRLATQETDLLLTINRPCSQPPDSADAATVQEDGALLRQLAGSLEVRDWGLFVS